MDSVSECPCGDFRAEIARACGRMARAAEVFACRGQQLPGPVLELATALAKALNDSSPSPPLPPPDNCKAAQLQIHCCRSVNYQPSAVSSRQHKSESASTSSSRTRTAGRDKSRDVDNQDATRISSTGSESDISSINGPFSSEEDGNSGRKIEEFYFWGGELGKGGCAVVCRGTRKHDKESCAIKCIDKSKFQKFKLSRVTQLDLGSEAKMLQSLAHPYIVQLYDVFETREDLYLVTEFVRGGDLLTRLLDRGAFETERTTKRVFSEILEALEYLHTVKHVVHRDLKPENILLSSRGEDASPKIADFGLAVHLGESEDQRAAGVSNIRFPSSTESPPPPRLRTAKTFCGTPHYSAPEVILTREKIVEGYTFSADMWSAGVVLYIMLTCTPPFDDVGLYDHIVDANYSFDDEEWESVSQNAKNLVSGLMEKDPERRLNVQQALLHPWLASESGSSSSQKHDGKTHIQLQVRNAQGTSAFRTVQFRMKKGARLKKLMDAYCKYKGICMGQVRFMVNGERVSENDTPDGVGLADDDVIDVRLTWSRPMTVSERDS